jgi:hypothetical protein
LDFGYSVVALHGARVERHHPQLGSGRRSLHSDVERHPQASPQAYAGNFSRSGNIIGNYSYQS